MKHWTSKLKKIDACDDAVIWANDFKTFKKAWDKCELADWMLWLAGKTCKSTQGRKQIVLVACKCARRALKYTPKDERRPLKAIQTAEKWAKNVEGVTLKDVKNTADAAYAAVEAAAAGAAGAGAYAAYAAAAAPATPVSTAAYASGAAAAGAAAAGAATYADAAAAKINELKSMAKIVRKYLKIKL